MTKKIGNGLDLQSQRIQNVGDPSASTDATNKQYVDNFVRGISWKAPVRAASTGNVTLATPGASMDGVTLTSVDRVLLKNQSSGPENGIYVWTGASSALTRSTDADGGTELNPGTAITVTEGTATGRALFRTTFAISGAVETKPPGTGRGGFFHARSLALTLCRATSAGVGSTAGRRLV